MKVGDVVQLNSGGPVMVLNKVETAPDDKVYGVTHWFSDGNELRKAVFSMDALHLVRAEWDGFLTKPAGDSDE